MTRGTRVGAWGKISILNVFIEPNWQDGRWIQRSWKEIHLTYQLCYFPLQADIDENGEVWDPGNFGVRGAEGPPFFHSGNLLVTYGPGGWDPTADPAVAEEWGVKPLLLAALPHLVEGAVLGEDIVAVSRARSRDSVLSIRLGRSAGCRSH